MVDDKINLQCDKVLDLEDNSSEALNELSKLRIGDPDPHAEPERPTAAVDAVRLITFAELGQLTPEKSHYGRVGPR